MNQNFHLRFSDRAGHVMRMAEQEARRLNHDCIGTNDLLLGLISVPRGLGMSILTRLGIEASAIRAELDKFEQPGSVDSATMDTLPQTPRYMQVLEYAKSEALNLGHEYWGSEHILLGLLREQEGIAAQVLCGLGASLDGARSELLGLLSINVKAQREKRI